jgi:predicted PurR-regulated permease PerM
LLTRSRGKLIVVSAATIVALYFCFRLAEPFVPALVLAVTAAVVTQGLMRWLARWVDSPRWRAALAVGVVTLVLFVPAAGLLYFAAVEIGVSLQDWRPAEQLSLLEQRLQQFPGLAAAWGRISQNLDLATTIGQIAEQIRHWAMGIVTGSVYVLVQVVIALFVLYFLYRDQDRALATVRRLSPLTDRETDRLLARLSDTIHATVFGTLVVALIQGALGGLLFWLIGLPAPVLWGTMMAALALIPYLGAFVVWAPAAVLFATQGEWGKSLLLVAWGTIVIGLIDNLLYPILVGNRLRQHTVLTFLAIVGGLSVFGASGIVLGPVVVSLTFFLLEVWRSRTAGGQAAEAAA